MDEETRLGGLQNGAGGSSRSDAWAQQNYDEPTHLSDEPGQNYPSPPMQSGPDRHAAGYRSSVYPSGPHGYQSAGFAASAHQAAPRTYASDQAPTEEAPRSSKASKFLAAATILTAMVVAVCLVLFFTQRQDEPAPTAGESTIAPQPSTPSSSSSSSASSSSSSSSTSATAAEFPDDAGTECLKAKDQSEANWQVVHSGEGTMTCPFIDDVGAKAREKIEKDPKTTSFSMDVKSPANGWYTFSCTRENHLSHCVTTSRAENSSGGSLGAYVKDTTN